MHFLNPRYFLSSKKIYFSYLITWVLCNISPFYWKKNGVARHPYYTYIPCIAAFLLYLICDIIWNFAAVFTHKGFKIVDRITRHFLSLFFIKERVKHNTHAWIKGALFFPNKEKGKKWSIFFIYFFPCFSGSFLCDNILPSISLIIFVGNNHVLSIPFFWKGLPNGNFMGKSKVLWD